MEYESDPSSDIDKNYFSDEESLTGYEHQLLIQSPFSKTFAKYVFILTIHVHTVVAFVLSLKL